MWHELDQWKTTPPSFAGRFAVSYFVTLLPFNIISVVDNNNNSNNVYFSFRAVI